MKDIEVHQEGDTMAEACGLKWQDVYLTPGVAEASQPSLQAIQELNCLVILRCLE